MPFNQLQRRESWPPTIVRLGGEKAVDAQNIDEDPISFFLTSPEDIDDDFPYDDDEDDEDLSAGIETPDSDHSPVRQVSPSSLQRERQRPLLDDDDDVDGNVDFGLAVPMTLKEFTLRHNTRQNAHTNAPEVDDKLKGLGISVPTRGRLPTRLIPTYNTRGRGQTRSLSARGKPPSWREPSPEIFPIPEEREPDEDRLDIKTAAIAMLSSSAPPSTRIGPGGLRVNSPQPKPKKRVHWAS